MPDYEKLYHIMVNASEEALRALESGNVLWAKVALTAAEREAEELYIASA